MNQLWVWSTAVQTTLLVVAPGLQETGVADRLARLRSLLRDNANGTPPVRFSVGTAPLEPGGHPDAALKAADEAMYAVRATTRHAR